MANPFPFQPLGFTPQSHMFPNLTTEQFQMLQRATATVAQQQQAAEQRRAAVQLAEQQQRQYIMQQQRWGNVPVAAAAATTTDDQPGSPPAEPWRDLTRHLFYVGTQQVWSESRVHKQPILTYE